MSRFYHSQILLYLDKLLSPRSDFPNQFLRFSFDLILFSNRLHIQGILFIQLEIILLCFPLVNELLLYMYLSQLMSTFTKLSKSALSSRWFLHPVIQGTSNPTITHVFTFTLVGHSRIHRGDHIPVIFCPYMLLSNNMGLSKCESTFLI